MVAASVTDGQQIIFLATHEGQAIRFDEEDVRPMGRQAYGVWGIRMEKGDYLVGMAGVRIEQGHHFTSARLLGAVAAEVATSGAMLWPPTRVECEHYGALCVLELGDAAYAAATSEGRHLDIDSAINLALELPALAMQSR